jgi:hypothetical protein
MSERTTVKAIIAHTGCGYQHALQQLRILRDDPAFQAHMQALGGQFPEKSVKERFIIAFIAATEDHPNQKEESWM